MLLIYYNFLQFSCGDSSLWNSKLIYYNKKYSDNYRHTLQAYLVIVDDIFKLINL